MDGRTVIDAEELSRHLWGKTSPYESIYSHSRKVAIAMEVLTEACPERIQVVADGLGVMPTEAARLVCYLAGVHDIGKIVPVWQAQEHAPEQHLVFYRTHPELVDRLDAEIYRGYRHERGSFYILMRLWAEHGLFTDTRMRRNLAGVVMTHHQRIGVTQKKDPPGTVKGKCEGVCAPVWMECQEELEYNYRQQYAVEGISVDGSTLDMPCMVMSGLLILADWMGSSLGEKPCEKETEQADFRETLKGFVSQMGLRRGHPIPDDFGAMWPWIDHPRPLQKTACNIMQEETPILTIIEDSMGAGKTEAALYIANHILKKTKKNGMYIALPTAATANQMHQRVDDLLDRFGIRGARLLHGTAWLSAPLDEDHISDAERFLAPSRMGLFAPYGVGTIDQVFLSVLKTRYGNLRMSGIADKVLIVDEVHAYDAYTMKELLILLEWCKAMSVPVILLSATLPKTKRQEFVKVFSGSVPSMEGYPRITTVTGNGTLTETKIEGAQQEKTYEISLSPLLNQEKAIAELALKTVEGGGTLCVNVNTVKRARTITEYLDNMDSDAEIYIFHSRYSLSRRQEIEEQCVSLFGKETGKRPRKAILVATQVVEQSLDIDFDYYITDLCPIDLVLQRMGRQFRHQGVQRPCRSPRTVVLLPEEGEDYGATEVIYNRYVLEKTRELLKRTQRICVPGDIQPSVDAVYDAFPSKESDYEDFYNMMMKNEVERGAAERPALKSPGKAFQFGKALKDGDLFDSDAKTRLAEPSVRVAILPRGLYEKVCADKASRQEQQLAYSYSFTVAARDFDGEGLPTGERMLKGIRLLEGKEMDYGPAETATAEGIRMDARYGVMITKGRKNV